MRSVFRMWERKNSLQTYNYTLFDVDNVIATCHYSTQWRCHFHGIEHLLVVWLAYFACQRVFSWRLVLFCILSCQRLLPPASCLLPPPSTLLPPASSCLPPTFYLFLLPPSSSLLTPPSSLFFLPPPPSTYLFPRLSLCHHMSCLALSCLALSCLVLSCLVLSCHVLSGLVLSCYVITCHVISCLVLSCLALSCLALSCLFVKLRQYSTINL